MRSYNVWMQWPYKKVLFHEIFGVFSFTWICCLYRVIDNLKWWNHTAPAKDTFSPWYNRTRNVNNVITSYAILALLESGRLDAALPALKWLMSQRNGLGGFVGAQDTILGLEAIIAFAQRSRSSSLQQDVRWTFTYGQNVETMLHVNRENALMVQKYQVKLCSRRWR